MKEYIEERVLELANYIIDKKTTVRYAAKKFGISKSTVHTVVAKWNGILIISLNFAKRVETTKEQIKDGRYPLVIGGGIL